MAVPEVNKEMLTELESMGFPTAHAIRGLHFSGNASIEGAIDWIAEHENDPDIDQMLLVPINIEIESGKPPFALEYVKIKAQELRQKLKAEEEKRMEKEREKERRRAGKEQLQAKKILEENERKRASAWRKAEQEEVKQARERILKRLEDDKAERRRNLGLPSEDHSSKKITKHLQKQQNTKISDEHNSTTVDNLQECLRSLKQNHLDEDARVKRAFQTLLTYIANVAKNPENEKFRKIRLSNPAFMDRVGSMFGGIEFLKLCGFEKLKQNGIEYLYIPRDKVDHRILRNAALELNSALNNPYFGMFSRKKDDY
ncbi:UBX domain-containing protein 1-like isoform X2 [Dioscorea cayenensis subsp. rotundata]|uniref:UBX domain-containing protein 1-like isoform X2 n=1 Tax=Dioscorea cayennensis subsp. rotundata TaxID=55577 RepID=A0AB40B7P1_DIOCR|nr:UBX domain-containing protein 1-like isoform X2 [Dioscorea cayenensis subsp. rotundata]